jgi:imidazolonepropionase-like amidohydrolase
MADADVELVAGTDAPAVPGMLPGVSLHDDLDALEASGLTRFQVLSIATRAPGAFIRRTKGGEPTGLVAPGFRADLVLTSGNPLDALATLRTPLGVMAGGRWHDAAELDGIRNRVRDDYVRAAARP